MSDAKDFDYPGCILPGEKRDLKHNAETALLRRQLLAAIERNLDTNRCLSWVIRNLGTTEADGLARSYCTFGEFTVRQLTRINAFMEADTSAKV